MTEATDTDEIPWGPLGEEWWLEAAAKARATKLQARFAACRFIGMSQGNSARLAGYAADDDVRARQNGSDAEGRPGVQTLLALATAEIRARNLPPVKKAKMTLDEAQQRLSDIARGPDQGLALRAIESINKLNVNSPDAELGRFDFVADGFDGWRVARDFLRLPGGASMLVAFRRGHGFGLAQMELLHDVVALVQRDDPDYWALARSQTTKIDLAELDQFLANPNWQLEARIKIWREVGIEIGDEPSSQRDKPSIPNGGQFPETERLPA